MTNIALRAFRSGELAPTWYAATNTQAYLYGLRKLLNGVVMRTGGIQNRSGTLYKGSTKSDGVARIIPAVFDDDQNYVLELGVGYVRFWKNGSPILGTVTGAWADATGYGAGQVVSYSGTNYVALQTHTSNLANDRPSTGANWEDYWYALTGTTYELPMPYQTQDELRRVQFAVQDGVVRFAYNGYTRRTLTRLSDNEWMVEEVTGSTSGLAAPLNLATSGTVGTVTSWVVTAYDPVTFRESVASASAGTSADLSAISTTPQTLTWDAVTGATSYRLYRNDETTGGVFGLIVETGSATFVDSASATADITQQPPRSSVSFSSPSEYPGVIGAYQQRILLSGTTGNPDQVRASKVGSPDDFSVSTPLVDSDAVEWRMVGQRAVRPLHFLEVASRLVQFASTGEYIIEGDDSGIISPGAVNPRQLSANGAAPYPAPVPVDSSALYIQARGNQLRDVVGDGGVALSTTAQHLFENVTIVEMAYQQMPDSVLWLVRSDGVLLSFTYDTAMDVKGWAQHTTDGLFKSVCVVQEGTEDAVYVVVERTINGNTKRYVERFANRQATSPVLMDCAIAQQSVSGTLTVGVIGLDLSENVFVYTVTASTANFVGGDVGRVLRLRVGGTWYTTIIVGYTSTTQVTVWTASSNSGLAGSIASGDWFLPPDLRPIATEAVSITVNGTVTASPYNPAYAAQTAAAVTLGAVNPVTAYTVTLISATATVWVGLPYVTDIQTLDIDAVERTIKDRGQWTGGLKAWVRQTGKFWAGPRAPSSATSIADLEAMVPQDEYWDVVTTLDAGVVSGILLSTWNDNGRVFLRQVDPVPLTLLGLSPQGFMGGR